MPTDAVARVSTLSWLFLQVAGVGPNFGNAAFFLRNDPSNLVAIERFHSEAQRHLSVLEQRLSETEWLNGESYSIADIAIFDWSRGSDNHGIDIAEFPTFAVWRARVGDREAVKRALVRDYVIPSLNLRTIGLGERFPRIPTEEPEAENRRVSVARITPLVGELRD